MRRNIHLFAALALGGLGVTLEGSPSFAELITYTDSFTASGSLGGTSFTKENVVITVTADTADVYVSPPGEEYASVVGTFASVQMGGSAPAGFIDPIIKVEIDYAPGYLFISDESAGLIVTTFSSALSGYELLTSVGPAVSDLGGYLCF